MDLLVGFCASESELWRVLLLSEDAFADPDDLLFFLADESSSEELSSEDESEESLELLELPESLELESDLGKGVLIAVFRVFSSDFLGESFSSSDDEEESEDESLSLSDDSLPESDLEEEEPENSEGDSLSFDSDTLVFLALGASFSDSDSEELDSAFRFTPVDLGAGAGAGAASSSSSSSASLSELEEEDADEDEDEDSRDGFLDCTFGASSISASESLESSELLSLLLEDPEELEELELADFFELDPFWPSQFSKSSRSDGAAFESDWELAIDLSACSLENALLVLSNPFSDRKVAIEAINCAGGDALELLLALVCFIRGNCQHSVLPLVYSFGILPSWSSEPSWKPFYPSAVPF